LLNILAAHQSSLWVNIYYEYIYFGITVPILTHIIRNRICL
jgi:hypothetical protein